MTAKTNVQSQSKQNDETKLTRKQVTAQTSKPPLLGFSVVASLWLWGLLAFYAPTYLEITNSVLKYIFNGIGIVAIIFSFLGALVEISKITKNQAFSYWGVSLILLIPAILLHFLARSVSAIEALAIALKLFALSLVALGGASFFQGVPYIWWKSEQPTQTTTLTPEEMAQKKDEKRKVTVEVAATVIVALLSLITAVVQLIVAFKP